MCIGASLNLLTRKAQGRADGRGLEEPGGDGLRYYGPQAKGSRVVAVTADWLMESVTTCQCRHVVVVAADVMEMGQLCCRRAPPGPWGGRALGPGWGSGL